jgi:hypothetical protein
MPYVYCESCGVGFYSNVLSCPNCRAPARGIASRAEAHRRAARMRVLRASEDAEAEVREALYGWHSGSVARVADKG